ncbi:MAG: sulfatase family protein [Pirellula sp.]|jgi:arylsulfatase A-like enzyme
MQIVAFRAFLEIALCVVALSQVSSESGFGNDRPNIIVIMADDLGYGDLSCYGATSIQTPNIDRLAASGIRFTSGYCSASTCTPTRYSFLTGKYAFRTPGTGVAPPNGPAIIEPNTVTIASLLKNAGYQTKVIGKWHLGLGQKKNVSNQTSKEPASIFGPNWNGELKPGPLEIGFHSCYLLPTTNDRVPQVYVADHRVENLDASDPLWVGDKKPSADHPTGETERDSLKMDWSHGHNQTIHNGISRIGFYTGGHAARFLDEDLADRWVEKSKEFIHSNRDRPFFLFFASHDIHVPRVVHPRFAGKSKMGPRGDCILQLDWCVGELINHVETMGLTRNTLFVFVSDNGPVMDDGYKDNALEQLGDHSAAAHLKGGKYSVYEGGTRTPFITSWPSVISPAISDEMVTTVDLARSCASLAGERVPDDACPDSLDLSAALLGKPGAKGRSHVLQQNNNGNQFGLRVRDESGDWKLVEAPNGLMYNVNVGETLRSTKVPNFQLFDLASDPGETTNVASQHVETTERLKEKLASIKSK